MEELNEKSKKNIFPIQPTFITRIKEYGSDDPSGLKDYDLNNHGIFGIDLPQGFLAVVSHNQNVNTPVTLYEFLPNDKNIRNICIQKEEIGEIRIPIIKKDSIYEKWLDGKFIIRTDNVNHFNLKECCSCFRSEISNDKDEAGIRFCENYDLRVSLFAVKGFTQSNIKPLKFAVNTLNETLDKDEQIILVENINRPFVYYKCPISGFYEAIFPIFFEKKIIGCIMVGEMIYNGLTDEKVYEQFNNFILTNNICEPIIDKIKIKIKADFSDYKTNFPEKLENSTLFIESIEKSLRNLERRIDKRVFLCRQAYISESFSIVKKKFQESSINKKNIDNDFDVLSLSMLIENSLVQICEQFPNENGFVRIFMADTNGNEKTLKILAASDRKKLINPEDYTYQLECIDPEIIREGKNISNDKNHDKDNPFSLEILKTLERGVHYQGKEASYLVEKNDIIRYYPTLAANVYFVIWKRYSNDFISKGHQFNLYRDGMFDFYTTIAANYAALWGSQMQEHLQNVVRISGHESNQIIPRIKSVIMKNFEKTSTLIDLLKQGTIQKKIDDLYNSIDLLKFLQERPAYLFKPQDLKVEVIDVNEIFFKLFNMYEIQLRHKGIWIDVIRESKDRININGDKILVEHILHNLVDNAVKYCFDGTRIQLKIVDKDKTFVIHVISFGPKINNKNKIYDLYHREQESVQGLGIGMYLVKKMVEAHTWQTTIESLKKYDYNIPCIVHYNRELNKRKERELLAKCSSIQLEKIKKITDFKESDYEEIINYYPADNTPNDGIKERRLFYKPGASEFSVEFEKETFKNDFIITISKKLQQ